MGETIEPLRPDQLVGDGDFGVDAFSGVGDGTAFDGKPLRDLNPTAVRVHGWPVSADLDPSDARPDFSDYATEDHSENEIWFTFGWPYETSACVTRLIFSGLFDKLPNLKIITHHMGGMIPYFADKVGLDDRFHETGLDEASIDGTGIKLVDSSFEKN